MLTAVSVARDCGMVGPTHKVSLLFILLFRYKIKRKTVFVVLIRPVSLTITPC